MPHIIILTAAAIAGGIAWQLRKASQKKAAEPAPTPPAPNPAVIEWDDVSDGAILGLEIGYGLIGL
ncbi:hypothetical protein LTR94_038238, partial [Friedmanniomyces endolithicus]